MEAEGKIKELEKTYTLSDTVGFLKNKIIESWNKDRFKMLGDYKIDRRITQAGTLTVFAFLFFVAWSYNFEWDIAYYACYTYTEPQGCHNPFYKAPTWKNQEWLPPGEYGTKIGRDVQDAGPISVGILIVFFIINHFVHNHDSKSWKKLMKDGLERG